MLSFINGYIYVEFETFVILKVLKELVVKM